MPKPNPPITIISLPRRSMRTGPGSILVDFEALLGFVEDGVRSTGKYHMLPMARLFELDELMARPLRPRLKRPQQRSFPHLNVCTCCCGRLNWASPKVTAKRGRLMLDSAMHERWLQLNATERYFTLLEAWLRRASWEVVGAPGGGWMKPNRLPGRPATYGRRSRRAAACSRKKRALGGSFSTARNGPARWRCWNCLD